MDSDTPQIPPYRLYAVVLSWNRPADTLFCLDSLARQEGVALKLLVVDNGSSDDSVSQIREKFPQAEMIVNPTNLGFGHGNNQGIRSAFEAGADYVFISNNDAYLDPKALATLLKYTAKDVGLLSPLIYYHSHPDIIWSSGGNNHPLTLEKKDEFQGKVDPGNWPETLERDFIAGCGMLFSRTMYERVGLFDDKNIIYYEDSDLCRRVREAGLRILVIPSSKMWHKVSMTMGGSDSPNERYWMAKSSVHFYGTYARGLQKPVVLFWRTASALRTSLRLARKGRWDSLKAYWRGLRDGLRAKSAA